MGAFSEDSFLALDDRLGSSADSGTQRKVGRLRWLMSEYLFRLVKLSGGFFCQDYPTFIIDRYIFLW